MAIDRAAILRNAEKLAKQSKLELAAAEYLRLVEDQPRDWNTANTLGDLYVRIGQTDKAVEQFARIADHLSAEGFFPKASALYKKILKLKPDDERTLLQMGEIAASQGIVVDARSYFTTVLERRNGRRDKRGAAEVRARLGMLDPDDFDGRLMAARAHAELRNIAAAVRELMAMASDLTSKGRNEEAFKMLREAVGLDPENRDLRASLARRAFAAGDLETAAEFLTTEIAGNNPEMLLVVAGIQLRGDAHAEGLAIVGRLLEAHPDRQAQIGRLGVTIAEHSPELGFSVVRLVVDLLIVNADLASAASLLQEFVKRAPNYLPALLRLVEISVDSGLESTMYRAQAQLADAYLNAGLAAEALFIAEDLMAREPWDADNVERLRRALELAGEPDPAGLIAERLSGRSPFMAIDMSGDADYSSFDSAPDAPPADAAPEPPVQEKSEKPPPHELAATAHAEAETVEVDLSIVLDAGEPEPKSETPEAGGADLDGVFKSFRDEAGRRSAVEAADTQYKRALELWAAGDLDGAVSALEEAARVPTLRFAAAAALGRLCRDRGMAVEAINWFERAAEAPAPSADDLHELLYDFAGVLETRGEVARALAMSLELQAEAGAYRDVAERVERLSKVQARG